MFAPWKRIIFAGGATVTGLSIAAGLTGFQNSLLAAIVATGGALFGFWFMIEVAVAGWHALGTVHARYHKHRYSMIIVMLVGAILGGSLLGGAWWLRDRLGPKPQAKIEPPASSVTSEQFAEFEKRFDKYVEDQKKQSPTSDDDSKLPRLREEFNALDKNREALTNEEKEALKSKGLTLQLLEDGKRRYLAGKEAEKRQQEIIAEQQRIEGAQKQKKKLEDLEKSELEFADQYAPIIQHTIDALWQDLESSIAKESGETLSSDFPDNNKPSIYNSKILKEGKIVGGQHVIRVGTSPDWEFRVSVMGLPLSAGGTWRGDPHSFVFQIQAAQSSVSMMAIGRALGEPLPSVFRLAYGEPDNRKQVECSLTEYREHINQAVRQLILDRYIASGLPKPKQP